MIIRCERDLDVKVGLLVYARSEVYLDNYFKHIKGPSTFHVYEVSIDARIADPDALKSTDVVCKNGEVIEFLLCKERVSTIDAVNYASKKLKLKLTYAGLKDSEAFTCQFVRALCTGEVRLSSRYSLLDGRVRLYTVGKTSEILHRGSLLGNYFRVLLSFSGGVTELSKALKTLDRVVNALPNLLLPNFFGYQRFGTRRPLTHLIGKAIAECNFEEAVRYIVGHPLRTESEKVAAAREAFERGELKESLRLFPRKFWIERSIIRKLIRGFSPKDAVLSLDHRILRLYVEAYQAYLFNIALSTGLLECGSVEDFSKRCGILPLPGPADGKYVKGKYCRDLITQVVKSKCTEICDTNEVRRLFSKKARPTYFKVLRPVYKARREGVWFEFELPSGSYATVLLREMLRGNLILP